MCSSDLFPSHDTTGLANVFNFIEVCKVEAWSSPYGNPQSVVSGSAAYTNCTGVPSGKEIAHAVPTEILEPITAITSHKGRGLQGGREGDRK